MWETNSRERREKIIRNSNELMALVDKVLKIIHFAYLTNNLPPIKILRRNKDDFSGQIIEMDAKEFPLGIEKTRTRYVILVCNDQNVSIKFRLSKTDLAVRLGLLATTIDEEGNRVWQFTEKANELAQLMENYVSNIRNSRILR